MRSLLLRLILCLSLSVFGPGAWAQGIIGPPNQITCNQVATMAIGPTTSTLLVGAVTGQRIYLCGFQFTNSASVGTATLTVGTGATCAGTPTTVIPPLSVGVSPTIDHAQLAYYTAPLSFALCVTPSVATITAVVWFSQF